MKSTRWGILGTGLIATSFAKGLASAPGAVLEAVASRNAERASAFARRVGAGRSLGSYEDLVNDANIDVVYIATPHSRHKKDCLLALAAGKPVLCEKPFTLNARDAREVFAFAREKQLFCMEAMWTRCQPLWIHVADIVQRGEIGEVVQVHGTLGIRAPKAADNRWYNLELGGGALLDLGVYPVSLTHAILGKPISVSGELAIGDTGVDEQCAGTLRFSSGAVATISASLHTPLPNDFTIVGTTGTITLHDPIYRPMSATLRRIGQKASTGLMARVLRRLGAQAMPGQRIRTPFEGNGYNYEALEVGRALAAGELESPLATQSATIEVLEILDELREQAGLRYPRD